MTDMNIYLNGGRRPSNIHFHFGDDKPVTLLGVEPLRRERTAISNPLPHPHTTPTVDDDGYAGHICANGISDDPIPTEIHAKVFHDVFALPSGSVSTLPMGSVAGEIDESGNWSFDHIGDIWHTPDYYKTRNWLVIYGLIGMQYYALDAVRVGAQTASTTACSSESSCSSCEGLMEATWFIKDLQATVDKQSGRMSFLPKHFTLQRSGIGQWTAEVGGRDKWCAFGLEVIGEKLVLSTSLLLHTQQWLIEESYDPLVLVWDVKIPDESYRLTVTE